MCVLITGGSGFIGTRLTRRLIDSGRDVVSFDSLHPQVHHGAVSPPDGCRLFAADVRDPQNWDRCFAQFGAPSAIVHLAAETGTGQSLDEATRHSSANVVGTTVMTDALVRHGIEPEQILLASSRAVYGEGAWAASDGANFYPPQRSRALLDAGEWDPRAPDGGPATAIPHEAAATWAQPTNVYAATKLAQEHVLGAWCSSYGVPLTILRLQNVYGPGQAVGNAYTGVLTFFARQISTGEQVNVYEDGEILRDFVFVNDVVSAMMQSLDHPPTSLRRCDIGSGAGVTLRRVAELMCAIGAASTPVVSGQYRLGDVRAASADIGAAQRQLDWEPVVSLEDGIGELMSWVPSQM